MASFTGLNSLDWDDRDSSQFFDAIVKSSKILDRFSIIDGCKSSINVPIFAATLVFDDDMCVYDPKTTADVTEKTFSVGFKRWGFHNCKDQLEGTYREKNLKVGQLNEETLDAQFANWVFDYFVKKNSEALLDFSWNGSDAEGSGDDVAGIDDEIIADLAAGTPTVNTATDWAAAVTTSNILTYMGTAFSSMGASNQAALFGDADRDYKPAYFLGTADYATYLLAVAAAETTTYEGVEKGLLKTYMGLEVLHYAPLATGEMMVTPPENLVIVTDNYNDTLAIQTEYDKKTNSDDIWGQYKIGFSYKQGDRIFYNELA